MNEIICLTVLTAIYVIFILYLSYDRDKDKFR